MFKKVSFIFLLAILAVLVVGCGTQQNATTKPASEDAVVAATATPQPQAEQPAETAAVLPTPVTDYCLECHTDKEELVAVAKPTQVVESENSGVG